MEYRGYKIENEQGHYKVITPYNETWTEDTIKDAKQTIDEELAIVE